MSDPQSATDMIERVAREIARYVLVDKDKSSETAEDFGEGVWRDFAPAACAVIKSMGQPTSTMIGAALLAAPSSDIAIQWPRMIDAALSKTEPTPIGG